MRILQKDQELRHGALALNENDYVISQVKVVNVLSKEIISANVYVKGQHISFVDYVKQPIPEDLRVVDGQDDYLLPGFIDTHMHIESTMLTPQGFADLVAPMGTTTVICDPHEIANVFGKKGVLYMAESNDQLPMRQLIDVPSCVPSVEGLEQSGATFHAEEIEELLQLDQVVGLAEVMDYEGVITGKQRMSEIVQTVANAGYYIQGHCPLVSGKRLAAYRIGGAISDHEATSISEIAEKIRNGFYIDIRESNTSRKLETFVQAIKDWSCLDRFTFCTDDRRTNVILREGHINGMVRKAIANGLSPLDAISFATINAAREANIEDLGAIAPGYIADMLLVSDLKEMLPSKVFFQGKLVAQTGKLLKKRQKKKHALENEQSIDVPKLEAEDFLIAVPECCRNDKSIEMNIMAYESYVSSFTLLEKERFAIENGYICLEKRPDLMYAIVINRHGRKNFYVCVVKRFGIDHGALASSVSHDSHNIVIVYDAPTQAMKALNQLVKQHGGMVAVEEEKIIATLPLPVAGLMTDIAPEKLVEQIDQMNASNRQLGNHFLENPISRITILSLLVSPYVKLSDLGLVDTETQALIPRFPNLDK
ncbi:MAG: adenine deaminase [Enterococcus avium]